MYFGFAVLLSLITLLGQLFFCFRCRGRKRLILPVILLAGVLLCGAGYGLSVWLEQMGQGVFGAAFACVIYGIMLLFALVGDGVAWALWAIVKLIQKRRK